MNLLYVLSYPHVVISFCENAERIAEEEYVPTVEDVLHARARTIGIKEITFTSKEYLWKYVTSPNVAQRTDNGGNFQVD